jgi:4-hydroxybenzoate polyprenyltransferase
MRYSTAAFFKNSLQFMIGVIIYALVFSVAELQTVPLLLGFSAFVVAYQAAYEFNDLVDYEEDRQDKFRRKRKTLASGAISREQALSRMLVFLVGGIALSALVEMRLTLLLLALLGLNFLHSSSYTRFKKKKALDIPLIFGMSFLKFAAPWAILGNLQSIPVYLIAAGAFTYVGVFFAYKGFEPDVVKMVRKNTEIAAAAIVAVFCYAYSIIIYEFRLFLIALLVFPAAFLVMLLNKRGREWMERAACGWFEKDYGAN